MTASRLREAADLLRMRAEAATPGPWVLSEPLSPRKYTTYEGAIRSTSMADGFDDQIGKTLDSADATYIAMMSPPVALALADWLDEVAARDGAHYWRGIKPALAVADAILGTPAKDAAAKGEGAVE